MMRKRQGHSQSLPKDMIKQRLQDTQSRGQELTFSDTYTRPAHDVIEMVMSC